MTTAPSVSPQPPSVAKNDWYAPLRGLQGLGKTEPRPGSLAGLAESRRRNLGQFFTPENVARFVWSIAAQMLRDEPGATQRDLSGRWSILDNSVGTGRLLQFATPEDHQLYGADVHAPSISALESAAAAAGFAHEFVVAGMEVLRPSNMSIGLINPPFSIHFDTPELKAYPSNTFGRFGPLRSARSEHYAIEQALDACQAVIAIVPASISQWAQSAQGLGAHGRDRLAAVFRLPPSSFADEGTHWGADILVFGPRTGKHIARAPFVQDVLDLNALAPDLGLPRIERSNDRGRIRVNRLDHSKASIDLPVTGDNTVIVAHDGRRLKLKINCGFAKARVMHHVLGDYAFSSTEERRYARYAFVGSAKLDIEAHIATGDARSSFLKFLEQIRDCGCIPLIRPGVMEHLLRHEKRSARQAMPMGRTIWDPNGSQADPSAGFKAKALKPVLINPKSFFGGLIEVGTEVEFSAADDQGRHTCVIPDKSGSSTEGRTAEAKTYSATRDEILLNFGLEQTIGGWRTLNRPLAEIYPQQAARLRARMVSLGIDRWLTWGFQQEDLIETMLKPFGCIVAWYMALGKTRLAVALCLMAGHKHNLISMPAFLVPEFEGKLKKLPIDPACWQSIDTPGKARSLRVINLISNERLRMELPGSRKIYADLLRRRIGLGLLDEGHSLANHTSQQSRAIDKLACKRFVILSATPIRSYPQDIHNPLVVAAGDGVACQPYGFRGPHLTARAVEDSSDVSRGIDRFREDFLVREWSFNSFDEDNRSGAARIVPKLANLSEFRNLLSPHIKRRVPQEPEVACDVHIPLAKKLPVVELPFTEEHLAFYLLVADEFASWWRNATQRGSKRIPMIELLVRIGALVTANGMPSNPLLAKHHVWRGGMTSKQRWILGRLARLQQDGHKGLLVCNRRDEVLYYAKHAAERGLKVLNITGAMTPARRHRLLMNDLRNGTASAAICTYDCVMAGLDLPEVNAVIHASRRWLASEEDQVAARALRSETKHQVTQEYVHHKGSIDDYQAQVVAFKSDTCRAGLDWLTPELADDEFMHLNHIIEQMVEDLATLRGMTRNELREHLKELA